MHDKFKIWDCKNNTWANRNIVLLQSGDLYDIKKKKQLNKEYYIIVKSTGQIYEDAERIQYAGDIFVDTLTDDIYLVINENNEFKCFMRQQAEPDSKYIDATFSLFSTKYKKYLGNIYNNPDISYVNYRYDTNEK